MDTFGKAQGGRREDIRFLTGQGRYVDDIVPAGALYAAFLRAPVAHAEIRALDTAPAMDVPGVRLVLTAADLEAAGIKLGMRGHVVTGPDGQPGAAPERPVLARGRVRFVGEPVACIIADSPAAARDGLEAVALDFHDLDAKTDLAPGGAAIHPEAPDNVGYRYELGDAAAADAAFAAAAHRVGARIEDNRIIAASMEPRGAFAEWQDGRLHLCFNGQGVWGQKAQLCAHFGLAPEDVRVTNPDVGGGFGMKAMAYPEYVVLCQAARVLGQPVHWMSDRSEAMLSDNAGRDLVSDVELAFDADLRITAYRVNTFSNLGAYNAQFGQGIQSEMFSKVLTGVYHIPVAHLAVKGIYTNTTQVDAYRGAGRPEAIYALESLMDHAARVLGVDRFDLRQRNFVREFPYRTVAGENYDVGDFSGLLVRLMAEGDVAGFAARRQASAAAGKLRGLGLASYIEAILGAPLEHAQVDFDADGGVTMRVGTQSNGQGHETVYARFLAAETGIPEDRIRILQGDSDQIATGGGTGGSRSVTLQTAATRATVTQMLAAFADFLAPELGDTPAFDDGAFRAAGANRTVNLLEAAELARAAGRNDLLRHRAEARITQRSFPNGAHLAEVEVDPDTGHVTVDRYTIMDDFGTLLAPELVLGQVHGGVVQGVGQVLMEHVVYDDQGQPLTGSFMDYAMPRSTDVPFFSVGFAPVPATGNPLGMKGCGEAGTVGAMAATANAVRDALAGQGIAWADMPFTPARVWQALQAAPA
ncbi:xanthine dehydrogenase, molybdenum binding subunit apoprotein [Gemmobacter megaterium]|uniref:Xanthine dehydrogenase, molybdenum binding subunit apoprotein n=1 Tax=Gemmobacter megaterium TaxID=1086013 RepID=A0A1N7KH83_9RHOB|nr:xanthine dehydrogenase family protein molybdopterin-binding subunit [Gemmobacter megaterium]GGE02107.1 carbon monoxide dehydrogenase [Gemmobacter megaterium]SIS60840.1 xanthine dehydrogenase, molybdenum binding subunit apoprotein [Gemmobacter megaterium]